MALMTPATIDKICKRNGLFYVPDRVRNSIERCLICDDENAITEEYLRLLNEFKKYRTLMHLAQIDYRSPLTLDAYTVYYLSRYMLIPAVALRNLALHSFFQHIPRSFSILDLGSGTGAVVLGLLSLFSNNPLSQVAISITTLDRCAEALERQKCLVERAGFDPNRVKHCKGDLCNIGKCIEVVTGGGPYHLIFLANCLTELEHEVSKNLIRRLPRILADNGAIIIAEAQRNYVKTRVKTLAMTVEEWGLHVYYPCSTVTCPPNYGLYCWVWREHEYDFPAIKVNDRPLQEEPRDRLILSWLILSQQGISVYDTFAAEHPGLLWGPISKCTGTERAVCYNDESLPFEMDRDVSPRYTRGSVVGLSKRHEVEEYYQM